MLTYTEAMKRVQFLERYGYLKLDGHVGDETFGWDRYLNQALYSSPEWREFRRRMILRDDGCDLADPDRPIRGRIIVHHLNPLTVQQVIDRDPMIFDPDNVICVSHDTHEAIHWGSQDLLTKDPVERRPGDTKLW